MKIFFLSILTTITVFAAKAQQPQENFEWAKHLTPDGKIPIRMIATLSGDIYTIASNQTDEDYDYYANSQNFITKLNAQGDTLWTKQINNYNINTANNDYSVYAEDLALDNAGNLYITGWFAQRVDFDPGAGTYILTSDTWVNGFNNIHGRDAFVVKINAQGNFVWAKKYSQGDSYYESFYSLAVDNAGNIYAAGQSNMNPNYGMLYKINANNGNVIWQKGITANKPRIALDNTNHICLTGYFSGTADFDPDATVYSLTSAGGNDVFISKLDTAGHFVWANRLGGTGDDKGKSLTTDNAGHVFVTGYYTGAVTTQINGTPVTLPSAAGTDGFIAKLNAADGNFLWVSSFKNAPNQTGPVNDVGKGIALDQAENVYVTGAAYTNPNNPYNTYDGITNFGQQYNGYGGTDIAIFKLNNTDGNFAWTNIIGGSGGDGGIDIGIGIANNIYVAGSYSDTVDFNPSVNNVYNLTDGGRFVMKMNCKEASTVSANICYGSSYNFHGIQLTTSGTYIDTLTNVNGCDSVATLHLTVNPIDTVSLTQNICFGGTYSFNGTVLNVAGIYVDTVSNATGCTWIEILNLTVNPIDTAYTYSLNLCYGAQWTVFGNTYTQPGVYVDTLNLNGCLKLRVVTITWDTIPVYSYTAGLCDTLEINGHTITQTGVYADTLANLGTSVPGCKLVEVWTVVPFQSNNLNITQTVVFPYTFTLVGQSHTFDTAGVYEIPYFLSSEACPDIVVVLTLIEDLWSFTAISHSMCEGDVFDFNGNPLTNAGIYYDTLTNVADYDSIITLTLNVFSVTTDSLFVTINQGDVYDFNGSLLDTPGIFTATLTSVNGCDSLVVLTLSVENLTSAVTINHTMCEGEVFDFNGNPLTNAGIYYDTLTNVTGYDSIITLILTVFPVTTDSLFATINQGDVYDFNGSLLDTPGIFTATLTSVNGCDSVVVLTLLVDNTTGISSVATNHELKMYPNPTGGIVYFSETVNVQATDAFGQVVLDKKNVNSLNLSDQPTGIYFLTLTDNKGQVLERSKIVKE